MFLFSFYVIIHISFVTILVNILAYRYLQKFISRIDCSCKITKKNTKWIVFHQKSMKKNYFSYQRASKRFWWKTSSNRFRDFFSALYLNILIIIITLIKLGIQKWRGSYTIARPASEAFALPCKSEREQRKHPRRYVYTTCIDLNMPML